jgi:insulysin
MYSILEKKENDNSNYIHYTLKNNLKIFLIEDTEIKESAVYLRVNVGYYQDEIPGQAHLLEHMLFHGSKNYSKSNYLNKLISNNNGHINATTKNTSTSYYYTIAHNKLIESLLILGDILTNPLLNNNINNEISIINAEHEKNQISDDRITLYVLKNVCNEKLTNFRKFSTGNEDSLLSITNNQLHSFFNKYYSSDLISLGIATNIISYDIIKQINNIFKKITLKKYIIDNQEKYNWFSKSKYIKCYNINNKDEIILFFEINSYYDNYLESPIGFLNYIFNINYNGSLYNILYNKQYIINLFANVYSINKDKCLYKISINLTKFGYTNKYKIINIIYCYIIYIINNINNYKDLYNAFLEKIYYKNKYYIQTNALDRIIDIIDTYNDIIINTKIILIKNNFLKSFDFIKKNLLIELNKILLSLLNNNNHYFLLLEKSNKLKSLKNNIKYFNNGRYDEVSFILKLNNLKNYNFKLPKINLIKNGDQIINKNIDIPLITYNNNNIIIFELPNNYYKIPDIHLIYIIKLNKLYYINKKDNIYIWFYFNYIRLLLLNNFNNDYNFNINTDKLLSSYEIIINIYDNYIKIPIINNIIISTLINIENNINNIKYNKTLFNYTLHLLLKNLKNTKNIILYRKIFNYFLKYINKNIIDNDIIFNILYNIKLKNLFFINKSIFYNCNIRVLLSGNIINNFKIINQFHQFNLFINSIKDQQNININYLQFFKFPNTKDIILIYNNNNKIDNNIISSMYIYITNNNNNDYYDCLSKLLIINNIMKSIYFDTLRTKEKLGYIVNCNIINIKLDFYYNTKYLYYIMLIQTPYKDYKIINERNNKFIIEFKSELNNLLNNNLDNIINSIIINIDNNNTLYKKSNYIFNQIINNKFVNKKEILINKLKNITINDIINFFEEKFINRKSLIISIIKN